MEWGRRKDNDQAYIKKPKKTLSGVIGTTKPNSGKIHLAKNPTKEEQQRARVDREIQSFQSGLSNYGSADVATAVETFLEAGLSGDDLAEQVREFSESTDTPIDKIDPVYVAYDHILQMARNKIDDVLKFDIQNDIKNATEFYTAGNYMATSYDYSEEAQEQLQDKLNEATGEQLEELRDNNYVKFFLEHVDVKLKKQKA